MRAEVGVCGVGMLDAPHEFGERESEDGGVGAGEVGVLLGAGLDGDIGGGEGGDVVLVGVVSDDLVLAAVEEMQAERLGVGGVARSVDDDGLVGGGDVGGGGLGEVGEEDVVPESGSGGRDGRPDVEDVVLEVFVEDAGLDLEGGLRGLEVVFEAEEAGGAAGSEVEGVEQAEARATMETMETMRTKSSAPMPLARMAVISESAARRLRPRRMPTRTAMGMVRVRALGRMKTKMRRTSAREAESRTTSSRILPRSRMKSTKVKRTPPRRAWEVTSRRM